MSSTGGWVLTISKAVLLFLIPVAGLWYAEARRSEATLKIGERLPPVPLQSLEGENLNLDMPGLPTVVIVFSTTCTFCHQQLERCDSLAEKFRGRLTMLGVSISGHRATRTMVNEYARNIPAALPPSGDILERWRISRIPSVFLIDPRGILVGQWSGVIPIEEEIDSYERLAATGTGMRP